MCRILPHHGIVCRGREGALSIAPVSVFIGEGEIFWFITEAALVRQIMEHASERTTAPVRAPAC